MRAGSVAAVMADLAALPGSAVSLGSVALDCAAPGCFATSDSNPVLPAPTERKAIAQGAALGFTPTNDTSPEGAERQPDRRSPAAATLRGTLHRAAAVVGFVGCALFAQAATPEATTNLIVREIEGVTYKYPPGEDAVVAALVPRVAEIKRAQAERNNSTAKVQHPLPPFLQMLRADRDDILRRIAAELALAEPTELQRECYDTFLANFENLEQGMAAVIESFNANPFFEIRDVTLYRRADLIRRLKAGEKVEGATLEPDGETGSFDFGLDAAASDELKKIGELMRNARSQRFRHGYSYSAGGGVARASATVSFSRPPDVKSQDASADAEKESKPKKPRLASIPLVIADEPGESSPEEIAAELAKFLDGFVRIPQQWKSVQFQDPSLLTLLILHETAEVGAVDGYIRSADRRWFCDGVANYIVWKVVRDRAGEVEAKRTYNLPAQLAKYAALREKVNLAKWSASEAQEEADKETDLNRAHYAFAARAIFLMVERHGEDFLPRLFREIGKTSRTKTNMRTVEKAYRKLTGKKLETILREAVAPLPGGGTA